MQLTVYIPSIYARLKPEDTSVGRFRRLNWLRLSNDRTLVKPALNGDDRANIQCAAIGLADPHSKSEREESNVPVHSHKSNDSRVDKAKVEPRLMMRVQLSMMDTDA